MNPSDPPDVAATGAAVAAATTLARREQPDIGSYAVIGDCRTAALVSSDGSVDWLCVPRFDSPFVFGALLDADRGGRYRVAPVEPCTVERRYVPDTAVLETTFETSDGRIRIVDALTVFDTDERAHSLYPDHELLRRVECIGGEVEIDVVCDPRMDYGRAKPRLRELAAFGFAFDHGPTYLVLRSDLPLVRRAGDGVGGRFRLRDGDRRYFSMTTETGLPPLAMRLGAVADQRLEHTVAWWQEWSAQCVYDGAFGELVRRSAIVLKLLAFPPSGAIIAAPTTSLPEEIGGSRNWDYRYCWLRDASMTLEALFDINLIREGEAFLGWLMHATRLTRPELNVVYDVHGRTDLRERTLDHLAGYRGARPVRIGNGAAKQVQLDIYGEVILAAHDFVGRGGKLDRGEGGLLSSLAESVCKRWREPDHGMWEQRAGTFHFTYSKAMCWVALEYLLELADGGHLELTMPRERIVRERDAIRDVVEARGFSRELNSYVATLDGDTVDASLLLLGIVGYADPRHERMLGTLECVRARLERDGLLHRYEYEDGVPGGEGAFALCTFWEAELLARQGRLEEAYRRFEHVASFANDVGLFAEEIDTGTGRALGNFPQGFTHIGLISAADAIARAEGRGPEQRAGRPISTESERARIGRRRVRDEPDDAAAAGKDGRAG